MTTSPIRTFILTVPLVALAIAGPGAPRAAGASRPATMAIDPGLRPAPGGETVLPSLLQDRPAPAGSMTPGGRYPEHAGRLVVQRYESADGPEGAFENSAVALYGFDPLGSLVHFELGEDFDGERIINPLERGRFVVNRHGYLVSAETERFGSRSILRSLELDARGNPLRLLEEIDHESNGTADTRFVTVVEYDRNGNRVRQVVESDFGADGKIEFRTFSTWAHDPRGNPVRAVYESDSGADGTIDWSNVETMEYDPQGRIVFKETDTDSDGNDVVDGRLQNTYVYTPQGSLLEATTTVDDRGDGNIDRRMQLWTVERDRRGPPLAQVAEWRRGNTGALESRLTITMELDERGDPRRQWTDSDTDGDGQIDQRERVTSEYPGPARPQRMNISSAPGSPREADASTGTAVGAAVAGTLGISPNPGAGATMLRFALAEPSDVSLRIHDLRGRLVRVLAEGARGAGEVETTWDGRDESGRMLPAGAYFARLRIGEEVVSRTILRVR